MQTKGRLGASPTDATSFRGEGMNAMSHEIEFRMRRLQGEAERERLAPRRDGLRHRLGHALMALGQTIHGIEAERPARQSLDAC